ncbi:uncharacterized protein SAPINGB_P004275 [Magnusiomyces paraingens]|uniref:Retrotransposon gag domain-containing protein n=1 Tax=Magnusiomyces paraingens TaxID=2606893 RepID=A0A5E8BTM4_9ASCO|nr:uncharacterized protein SAPINGB_P004275 [Saprochaete ingens]VVT54813.1 unnamed protein product [Saprochaete ingens]
MSGPNTTFSAPNDSRFAKTELGANFRSNKPAPYAGIEGSYGSLDQRYVARHFLQRFESYMLTTNVGPGDWPRCIVNFLQGEIFHYAEAWQKNVENFGKTWDQYKREFLAREHPPNFRHQVVTQLRQAAMKRLSVEDFDAYVKIFRTCRGILDPREDDILDLGSEEAVNEFVQGLHPSIYQEWYTTCLMDLGDRTHIRERLDITMEVCRNHTRSLMARANPTKPITSATDFAALASLDYYPDAKSDIVAPGIIPNVVKKSANPYQQAAFADDPMDIDAINVSPNGNPADTNTTIFRTSKEIFQTTTILIAITLIVDPTTLTATVDNVNLLDVQPVLPATTRVLLTVTSDVIIVANLVTRWLTAAQKTASTTPRGHWESDTFNNIESITPSELYANKVQFGRLAKSKDNSLGVCVIRMENEPGGEEGVLPKQFSEFSDVVTNDPPDKLPPQKDISHRIDTIPTAKIPAKPPYRLSQQENKILTTEIEKLIKTEFIRPS